MSGQLRSIRDSSLQDPPKTVTTLIWVYVAPRASKVTNDAAVLARQASRWGTFTYRRRTVHVIADRVSGERMIVPQDNVAPPCWDNQ